MTAIENNSSIGNNSPVVYNNVNITGDLDLNTLNLTTINIENNFIKTENLKSANLSEPFKIVRCPIRIINSRINGTVNFNNTIFENSIDFSGTNFTQNASFMSSQFDRPALFNSSNFGKEAEFSFSKFNNYAFFEKSNFNGHAGFTGSNFSGHASFTSTHFKNDAYFSFSTFCGPVYFTRSNFDHSALFQLSNFNEPAYFIFSKFKGAASFAYSTFKGNAFFLNAAFSDTLDLSLAGYDKLYIDWNEIGKLYYDNVSGDTSYQLLIENFKNLGFMDDADNCYYQFRVEQFLKGNSDDKFISPFNFGAWIFYGFGKKPIYPLLWSIFFIILFGFLWWGIGSKDSKSDFAIVVWIQLFVVSFWHYYLENDLNIQLLLSSPLALLLIGSMFLITFSVIFWMLARLNKSEDPIDEHLETQKSPRSVPEALVFSATVFLSGTKLFIDPPAIPILQNVSGSFVKMVFVMERLLGAFFSILFFLAIGATIVRS